MIPSGIIEALFTAGIMALGWLCKWGVQRIVEAQKEINDTLKEISVQLGQAINRVVQLETWVEQREIIDSSRHAENKAAIQALNDKIDRRRRS